MRLVNSDTAQVQDRLAGKAEASVHIGPDDFERLQLRDFEPPTELSPCLRWCHSFLGSPYTRWEFQSSGSRDTIFFARVADALNFIAQFGEEEAVETSDILIAA